MHRKQKVILAQILRKFSKKPLNIPSEKYGRNMALPIAKKLTKKKFETAN